MRVAVADDEVELAAQVVAVLENAGIACDSFPNGTAIQTALKRDTYDVLLLDWNMPAMSGIEVLKWAVSTMEAPPPIIMLTARSEQDDIVKALEAGACDYIVKPESPAIIVARVRAAARRNAQAERERTSTFGPYSFDNLERSVTVDGNEVKLTSKEFDLAALFFRNLNRPLSRSYLLAEIWGSSEGVETRTLDMHVSRIRSKLGLRADAGFAIQSVFGFGYRLERFDDEGE